MRNRKQVFWSSLSLIQLDQRNLKVMTVVAPEKKTALVYIVRNLTLLGRGGMRFTIAGWLILFPLRFNGEIERNMRTTIIAYVACSLWPYVFLNEIVSQSTVVASSSSSFCSSFDLYFLLSLCHFVTDFHLRMMPILHSELSSCIWAYLRQAITYPS